MARSDRRQTGVTKAHPRAWRERVEQATVRLKHPGGQGVLVPGGLVLTAAHCVPSVGSDEAPGLDHGHSVRVATWDVREFRLTVMAVEPVSDLAVLGAPDAPELLDDWTRFEEWCETTEPIRVDPVFLDVGESVAVHVLSHAGRWIEGQVSRDGPRLAGRLAVEFHQPIQGGAPGSPVVADDGSLIGIVAFVSEVASGRCNGMLPIAHAALPRWVLTRIEEAQHANRTDHARSPDLPEGERLRRAGYARRAGIVVDELRHDIDRLRHRPPVTEQVFDRIDRCVNAYSGGGNDAALTAATRFMFFLSEAVALTQRGSTFDPAAWAREHFASEYPELAATLTAEDWRAAVAACKDIGKRGKAQPWQKLARIFAKTGRKTATGRVIDGENLTKACFGVRNTPGRVLFTMRWQRGRPKRTT